MKPKGELVIVDNRYKLVHCTRCNSAREYDPVVGKSCPECGTAFWYKCEKCAKNFPTPRLLHRHVSRYCNNEAKLRCDHCEYVTNQKVSLAAHIQARHLPDDPSSTQCAECGKVCSNRSNLVRHSKLCGAAKVSRMRFYCDFCGFGAAYKANLEKHVSVVHAPRASDHNKCPRCEKVFRRKGNLEKHLQFCGRRLKIKKVPKLFFCDYCDYKTTKKPLVANHIEHKHDTCCIC